MSCEVAALLFKAHANYGNWSIDFDVYILYWVVISLKTSFILIRLLEIVSKKSHLDISYLLSKLCLA